MAKLNEQQLKAQLKADSISNAYLFYGDENYIKELYVSKLKKKLVDPSFESFNYHRYDGRQCDIDDIIKDAEILPMMSEYNFVYVSDFQVEKSKENIKALKDFLGDIPETTVLLLCYSTVEPDVKSAGFKAVLSAFDKAGTVVEFAKKSEGDLVKLIVSKTKKSGCTISSSDAKYLVSVVGSDITALLNELDKLCSHSLKGEISKKIIDELATKSLQARIYDLSKAVVSGDAQRAYSVLNTLFAMKEEPILLLSVIGSVYIDMYRVKCAKAAGASYDDVAQHFNYRGREFALRNASRDCASLSQAQLRKSLDIIAETDAMMKSTSTDKRTLTEELIIKLLMAAREG